MSTYPTDDSVHPTTPLFDETVSATSVHVEHEHGATGSASAVPASNGAAGAAKDTVQDAASNAKDTASQAAGQAKEQAQQVGATAADAGQRVAATTKDQASKVASDAVGQAKDLYGQATAQLSDQAAKQQKSAASTLRTFGEDLSSMHEQHGGGGLAAELVQSLAKRADHVAGWLEAREPAEVLDEVKQFAARRPGFFIALAAVTGIVAARATKALVADAKPDLPKPAAGSGHRSTTGPEFDDRSAATEPAIDVPRPGDPYGTAYGADATARGDVR